MGDIKKNLADSFADGRTAGLAKLRDGDLLFLDPARESSELGALPRSIRTIEDEETALKHMWPI